MNIDALIDALPKAELHLHIEGTLEPAMMLALAERNNITLPYKNVAEIEAAYEFDCLQDFLDLYYHGMSVLIEERDFYELTYAYIEKVHQQGVIHAEIFYDPQGHTGRGVSFETVLGGISSALQDAERELGITSKLIMCFLRHLPEDEAFESLQCACKHKELIHGVGLDSSEKGYPPALFSKVFAQARREGFIPVAHAGEEGPAEYVEAVLDDLKVQRVDHGNRSFENPALVQRLAKQRTPLTMCPLSNLRLKGIPSLELHPLKKALDAGLMVSVNSDDPSYFGGYIAENYKAVQKALGLQSHDIVTLAKNSFVSSFLDDKCKQSALDAVDEVLSKF